MGIDAPLRLYRDTVRPEWIDYNGHMNLAYYVVAFDLATDAFLDFLGFGLWRGAKKKRPGRERGGG